MRATDRPPAPRRQAAVPASDAAAAAARLGSRWEALRDARLFVTGGTGFVGTWLLATLCAANRHRGLNARAVVLTRDPGAFCHRAPDLAGDEAVELREGDVREVAWLHESFSHIIHGAATSDAAFTAAHPAAVRTTIVEGTRRVLELAKTCGAARLLALSSGAVYRQSCSDCRLLSEDDPLGTNLENDDRWVYHEAKRQMESLVLAGGKSEIPAVSVARLFAFVGPRLPLDRHFAIGNFLADAAAGRSVSVHGDGTPVRSYLYAADMAAWLWAILLEDRRGGVYNVGSERAVTIAQAAGIVASAAEPPVEVSIEGACDRGGGGGWYVPDTRRARGRLALAEWTPLEDAVRRTMAWQREEAQ
jgi:dTDP-glucose 4,6-dehydratase